MQHSYTIIKVEEVDSTNRYALEEVDLSSTEDFSVVWAPKQFAGKGQLAALWESEPFKNLTFSIITYPAFLCPSEQFKITQAVSIGVIEYLQQILPQEDIKIKWPNDIYVGNKKICGILTHNKIIGSKLAVSIIGVGLNVNQEIFKSNAPNPISLKQLTQKEYDLEAELNSLLQHIEKNYHLLKLGKQKQLNINYLRLLLNYKKKASYCHSGQTIQATITGVNEYGHLQLDCSLGEKIECGMKEIQYLF